MPWKVIHKTADGGIVDESVHDDHGDPDDDEPGHVRAVKAGRTAGHEVTVQRWIDLQHGWQDVDDL